MSAHQLQERYGKSQDGNFQVRETIGVPHPYCITPKHVVEAANRHGGILGKPAIQDAEKAGARCGVSGCRLSFAQHEQALLISCKVDLKNQQGDINPELQAYLLQCKPLCEADGYAGFAFIRA